MDKKNLFHDLNAHRCRNVGQPDKSGLFLMITKDKAPEISVNSHQKDKNFKRCGLSIQRHIRGIMLRRGANHRAVSAGLALFPRRAEEISAAGGP